MKDVRVAIREALVTKLNDSLGALDPYGPYPYDEPYEPFPVVNIVYRPSRKPITLPAITIFDSGEKVDDQVPLFRRTLQIDIWTSSDLDQAEAIAHRVNALLDHQPLVLTGGEGQVAMMMLQSDQDMPSDDADLVRKMLTYTLYVYDYEAPQPFGLRGTVGD
jgi:hypothetical protein